MFAIQVYCDFGGYCDIAIGSAKIMGHNLTDNFKTPYFSKQYVNSGSDGILRLRSGCAITSTFLWEVVGFRLAGCYLITGSP